MPYTVTIDGSALHNIFTDSRVSLVQLTHEKLQGLGERACHKQSLAKLKTISKERHVEGPREAERGQMTQTNNVLSPTAP